MQANEREAPDEREMHGTNWGESTPASEMQLCSGHRERERETEPEVLGLSFTGAASVRCNKPSAPAKSREENAWVRGAKL